MEIKTSLIIPKPLIDFGFESSEIWAKNNVFKSGESYQIVAHSGVGKSSLINILYGIRTDFNGKVHFDNKDISTFSLTEWTNLRRHKISNVFQGLHLFEDLTLMENIQIKNSLTDFQSDEKIIAWIETVGLSKHLYQKAKQLSFGQRQRIAVIRALCQPFEFIFLDEPFSHLDEINTALLMQLIWEEAELQNAGIILTSLNELKDKRFQHVLHL